MQKRKNTTHSVVDRELYLIPSRMFERVIFYMQDRFWDGKEPIGLIKTQNHNLNITLFFLLLFHMTIVPFARPR